MEANIMNRVKTFEDAVNELGNDHKLVKAYNVWKQGGDGDQKDADAFFKLRIIAAALNEGWKPQFTADEKRYSPWFYFYTQKEIDNMSEEGRAKIIPTKCGAYTGFVCEVSSFVPSPTHMSFGSNLCFKNRELAEYAGKQFADIYIDYYASSN